TAEAQATTLRWLASKGFSIDQTYSDRLLIDVSGTAAQIDSAFQVKLSTYRTSQAGSFYANDRNPTLPSNLAPIVQNVMLNNYGVGHSNAIPLHLSKEMRHAVVKPNVNGGVLHLNGNRQVMLAREKADTARHS